MPFDIRQNMKVLGRRAECSFRASIHATTESHLHYTFKCRKDGCSLCHSGMNAGTTVYRVVGTMRIRLTDLLPEELYCHSACSDVHGKDCVCMSVCVCVRVLRQSELQCMLPCVELFASRTPFSNSFHICLY